MAGLTVGARARRARLQGARLRAGRARRQGALDRRARHRGGRPQGRCPGEHGFRFFPGFYHHIPDTMRRIPDGKNPDGRLQQPARRERRALGPRQRPRRRAALRHRPRPGRGDDRRRHACAADRGDREAADGPAARGRVLRRAGAGLPHLVRRAPLRRVGVRAVVGLHRRRESLRRVPEDRRARPHPLARGREGDGRLDADDRQHGRGLRHEHHGPRQRRRPRPRPRSARPTRPGSSPGCSR